MALAQPQSYTENDYYQLPENIRAWNWDRKDKL